MNSDVPKVLHDLSGKPLIAHVLDAVVESGIDDRPVVVIGYRGDEIRAKLGDNYEYVTQDEPKGTGHAVQTTEELLSGHTDNLVVLYGDHPFIKLETLRTLVKAHSESDDPITMATTTVANFDEENGTFLLFGRIVRDSSGRIIAVIEQKDATQDQLEIRELNPGYYCFTADWLWKNLKKIENKNVSREYYLTDLVRIAIENGTNINSIAIDPSEAISVNTPADLSRARSMA